MMTLNVPQPPPFLVSLPRGDRSMRFQVYASSGEGSPHGQPGTYRATYVFAPPGKQIFLEDVDVNNVLTAGDSQLVFPRDGALRLSAGDAGNQVIIFLYQNSQNRLARSEMRVYANSLADARRFTYGLISSLLSTLCFRYDVAIDILGFQLVEESTGVHHWSFNILGYDKTLRPDPMWIPPPGYKPIVAAYREAVRSSNPFYKFLCFYRVIEGSRNQRQLRRKEALSQGTRYRSPIERIPRDLKNIPSQFKGAESSFAPHLGKKFTDVVSNFLRADFRNAIAHMDPTESVLSIDSYDDVERTERIIPLVWYISREMLKSDLAPIDGHID